MGNVLQWLVGHQAAIAMGALFILSEVVALIPSLQSNSLVQLAINILKKLEGSSVPALPAPSDSAPKA